MNKTTLKNKLEWENKILKNNNGEDFMVIEYINTNEVKIQFIKTKFIKIITFGNLKKGSVSDPMSPSIYGIGYLGDGIYKTKIAGSQTPFYKIWQTILQRCYDKESSSYKNYGAKGVTVCEEWQNYQNFASWYNNTRRIWMEDWVVDKDLLFKHNNIYSPTTCCFLPNKINNALTKRDSKRGDYPIGVYLKSQTKNGKVYNSIIAQLNKDGDKIHLGCFKTIEEAFNVYKIAKENHMKELALEYKDLIEENAYNALINYSVDFND